MTNHDDPTTHPDVAVVGAGIAGLTAAIELAERGRRVVVFDARRSPGGRARTTERDGFLLNEGAHALYVDGPAWRLLESFGRVPAGGTPDAAGGIGVDGLGVAGGVSGPLPSGVWSLLRSPLIAGERWRVAKLLAGIGRMDTTRYDSTTVDEAIGDLLGHGRAGRLGHGLLRLATYGNDPAHSSAGPALAQLAMAVDRGVHYLDGGWQTIVDSLRAEAERRDVEIRAGAKVTAVTDTADGVTVSTDAESFGASAVVLAAGGPAAAAAMLTEPSPDVTGWAADARPCTVACLDIGLDEPWGDHPTFALGTDRPLYLSVHAPVARLAPAGRPLVHVMRYHQPDETPDAAADRVECEALLDHTRPGWRDAVAHEGFRPRLMAAHDQPKAAQGGLAGRPPVAVPGRERVFVAGDWVGPEGLLADASVASARSAAERAAMVARRTVAS